MSKEMYIKAKNQEVEFEAKLMNVKLFEEIKDIPWITVKSPEDEDVVVSQALSNKKVAVSFEHDAIIPLENIIAKIGGKGIVLVHVNSAEEARTVFDTLEVGADGVILETDAIEEVSNLIDLRDTSLKQDLKEATVTVIKPSSMGYRVCVDTADLMREGEGMLVGTSSSGLLLVEAEVKKNEFVATRPFRVNAGAVSLYTLLPSNKTQYLSELKAGSEVLIVDREGTTRTAVIARCKIEKRPMILIEAKVDGIVVKGLYQNAETIRFVQKIGSIEITSLKPGDKILVKVEKKGGRHFGMKVENETIIEK